MFEFIDERLEWTLHKQIEEAKAKSADALNDIKSEQENSRLDHFNHDSHWEAYLRVRGKIESIHGLSDQEKQVILRINAPVIRHTSELLTRKNLIDWHTAVYSNLTARDESIQAKWNYLCTLASVIIAVVSLFVAMLSLIASIWMMLVPTVGC